MTLYDLLKKYEYKVYSNERFQIYRKLNYNNIFLVNREGIENAMTRETLDFNDLIASDWELY